MKKLVLFLASILVMGALHNVHAQVPFHKEGTITLAASATSGYEDVLISAHGIGNRPIASLDSISIYHVSGGGTGTVSVLSVDAGGLQTTLGTTAAMTNLVGEVLAPRRSVAQTTSGGYVTTNYPVQFETAGADTTNYYMVDVLVPVTTTASILEPYLVRTLRVSVAQPAHATVNTYKFTAYFK